jgi:hypothetical protein
LDYTGKFYLCFAISDLFLNFFYNNDMPDIRQKSKSGRIAAAGLVLFWLAAIITLYYVNHKPFTPELALALAQSFWRLITIALIISIAGGLGYRLARLPEIDPLARMAMQVILGLGIFATALFILGSTIGLPLLLLWAALPVLVILLFRSIRNWWREWLAFPTLWKSSSLLGRWVMGIIALMFLASLLTALAPPLQYDALMYHLTLPQAYLDLGRVVYLPWLVMSGMPQFSEMLYSWAMTLAGTEAAAVLGWAVALLTAFGLLGYLRARLNPDAAIAGLGALFCGYTLATSTAWGYVDWFGLAAGFACLVTLDHWRQGANRSLTILCGGFAGLAFAAKYTGGVLLLAAGAAILYQIWKTKRVLLPTLLWFSAGAAIFMLPWLIRNGIATGNPLYPFLLPGGAMDSIRMAVYQGLPAWGNALDLFLLPLRATLIGVDGMEGYSVSLGPLLLGLGALSILAWQRVDPNLKPALENATVLGAAGLLVWVIGNQISGYLIQTRMYFSLLSAFAVLAAFGWQALTGLELPGVRLRRLIAAMLLLVLGLNLVETGLVPIRQGAAQVVLGFETRQTYLERNLGWYTIAMQTVQELPEGSQVLMLYEPRGYYCTPRCDPDEILDENMHSLALAGSAEAALQTWQTRGFTHILYYRAGADFLRSGDDPHHNPADIAALETMLATLPEPQSFGGVYELYSIIP